VGCCAAGVLAAGGGRPGLLRALVEAEKKRGAKGVAVGDRLKEDDAAWCWAESRGTRPE